MENNVYNLTMKLWDKMGLNYRYVPNKGMSVDFEDRWWGMQVLKGNRSGVRFTVSLKGLVPEERVQEALKEINTFNMWFSGMGYCILDDWYDEKTIVYQVYHYTLPGEEITEEHLQMIFDQAKNMEMFGHSLACLNY